MKDPEAAVAIVCTRGPEESILLMRRSSREGDPWSAQWCFPGGRRQPSDIDLLHTAVRELEEECGIRLHPAQLEVMLPPAIAGRGRPPFIPVGLFVFRVDGELPTTLNAREADEVLWVSRTVLLDPGRHSLRPVPGQPVERHFPAIDLKGLPLWGFTYRVITDWLGLVPKGSARRQAVFETADRVLDWLLTEGGVKLDQGWSEDDSQLAMPEHHLAKTCRVKGIIPVNLLRRRFPVSGSGAANLLFFEVQAERICITGLDFEQYLILAATS